MVSPRSRTRLSLDARRQNGRFLARAAAEQYQLSPRQAGLGGQHVIRCFQRRSGTCGEREP